MPHCKRLLKKSFPAVPRVILTGMQSPTVEAGVCIAATVHWVLTLVMPAGALRRGPTTVILSGKVPLVNFFPRRVLPRSRFGHVVERRGKRFVLVEEADLERLERQARRGDPRRPSQGCNTDQHGCFSKQIAGTRLSLSSSAFDLCSIRVQSVASAELTLRPILTFGCTFSVWPNAMGSTIPVSTRGCNGLRG
jgi:hypothetical protein